MRPIYDLDDVKVYNATWEEVLPGLPAASVDLVIADPPYGISNGSVFEQDGYERSYEFGEWDRRLFALAPLFVQIKRVLKPDGMWWCFFDHWRLDTVREAARAAGLQAWIPFYWLKTNPSPAFGYRQPMNATEAGVFGAWSGNDKVQRFSPGVPRRNVFEGPTCDENIAHRARKPVWLLSQMIQLSSKPKATVLDPCCGAGSTLRAAKDLGRHAIGIEPDADHARAAIRRLGQGVLDI